MTDYTVIERKQTIAAPASEIQPLITNFHRWIDWSPWENIDPDLNRIYSGPESGVGATYEWSGNRKAGAGTMKITSVTADAVDVDLNFTKPFKSRSKTYFSFAPDGDGTVVTWQVHSPKTFMTRVFSIFMNLEKMVGPDLEHGLTQLKAAAEK